MCGIAGLWDRRGQPSSRIEHRIGAMCDVLRHRGPDDSGTFVDIEQGVALGSRRLAVVDLSPTGHQPMRSSDGRYVLAYNGELYNHPELREELERAGSRFEGTSDTEVLLAAVQRWGLETALRRFEGMFALTLWDRADRLLHIARDRFGEKPLYYGWSGKVLVLGSELKALRAHPEFEARVDRDSLALYFRYNCIPSPWSIYEGVRKLEPGACVTFTDSTAPGEFPPPKVYWALRELVETAVSQRSKIPPATNRLEEDLEELESTLERAVRIRTRADVPLGAFLSGGVDSSLVVAIMQKSQSAQVRTFTMCSEASDYDESAEAGRVASHLGTLHTDMVVHPSDALALVPSLPEIYDEPFGDSSQIPTVLLSKLTREHVTVALSGDGGDEIFGGYNRYLWARDFWSRLEHVPAPIRRVAGSTLGAVPPAWWDKGWSVAGRLVPARHRIRMPGIKVQKAARVLSANDTAEMHFMLSSHLDRPEAMVSSSHEHPSVFSSPWRWPTLEDPIELMMFLDSVTYLPDDILTKVDRATMSASLESRLPYLDESVARFAWRQSIDNKVRDGRGKWLLRKLLERYVPAQLVDRPKVGFGVPLGSWLRGPLREWAEDLLDDHRIAGDGYLSRDLVRRLWTDHLSGRHERQYELWDVLMFQAWLGHAKPQI
jgi:asparagine synthase (glutamine-hydrolysing)